jgi:tRNA pseudouridine38-40 synthase
MNRYFIELSFRGTRYHGWQNQPNAASVQAEVEAALAILAREKIKTTGAGRTDTGVHARYFVAHFDGTAALFSERDTFVYNMNALLPADIAILDIYPVTPGAHARYSALSRTYEYTISLRKDPFDEGLSWYHAASYDLSAMNEVAGLLSTFTDFTSFSKLHTQVKTNICYVEEAAWKMTGHKVIFTVRANRFLRNMVRALVGTMVDVGRGKISREDFIAIFEGRNRNLAGFSAPAEGLSLVAIQYPATIRTPVP